MYHQKTKIKLNGKLVKTKPFSIWDNMISRTCRRHLSNYSKYYFHVTLDDRWKSFRGFWDDMGATYFEGASLDRENSDLGYTKSNCRWVTILEQKRNRRHKYRKSLAL